MNSKYILAMLISLSIHSQLSFAQQQNNNVQVAGAMRNVMQKGQLEGTILLDTIAQKNNLYGLGPKAYLKGELLIIDGQSFVSSVNTDGSIKIEKTFQVEAPFLVYTNNDKWKAYTLPQNVTNTQEFEQYLDDLSKNIKRPFVFKLQGTYALVDFHIQNLPDGTVVKSPKDAHQGQGKYSRNNVNGDIVGFFSTTHQSVFTHHDTYIHLHFINTERTEMGHIDKLLFDASQPITLLLPSED